MNRITKGLCKIAYALNHPKPPEYVFSTGGWPELLAGLDNKTRILQKWLHEEAIKAQEYIKNRDNWGNQFELEYQAGIRDAYLEAIGKIREIEETQRLDIPDFVNSNSVGDSVSDDAVLHPMRVREMLEASVAGGDVA
ncbi:hypothetical protein [Mobiluncus mulieris]|uniref:Uncharacterized protein n=1 Tax=Mobiluncus mulieris TaxID=2052 RepID=A0A7Y0YHD5_9ACTO|nr:hypothetical protein [Mobiluncus mulieris]NMX02833.1 hypothetical protein [Mobiluncus mulieris]